MRVLLVLAAVVLVLPSSPRGQSGDVVTGPIGQRADRHLTALTRFGFSGAVLVAVKGEIVLRKGYGLADRAAGVPYTADIVSGMGSVTKQFTGAAILKLEMQGRLRVEDPIAKYLPGVPADKSGITIHHLLTHTAGFSGDLGGSDEEPIGRDALVARVLAAPLVASPGQAFEYSNEGFSLAAAIVERVSGQGYEAFLRQHLFMPAGMRDTGYLLPAWPLPRLAIGYFADGRPWGRVYKNGWLDDGPGWYLRGNGGLLSTPDDLYRWHQALAGTQILSAAAVRKFQTGHVPSMGRERYGYGWGVSQTRRGTQAVTHNGGNQFFFTDVRRYLDEDVVIIAMSNQSVVPATMVAPRDLESLVFGDAEVAAPPAIVDVPRESRARHAGTYALESGRDVRIAVSDAGLELTTDDPALFGTLGGIAPAGGRFAQLETRTRALVEASARGDHKPIIDAFNDDRPFDVVNANQARFWQRWRDDFGAYQGYDLIGTGIQQGDPAVVVRLRFERGGPVLRYVWGPRRLAGFMVDPAPAAATLLPESPDQYAVFAYRQQLLVRVTFTAEGGRIDPGGGAPVLRFSRRSPGRE